MSRIEDKMRSSRIWSLCVLVGIGCLVGVSVLIKYSISASNIPICKCYSKETACHGPGGCDPVKMCECGEGLNLFGGCQIICPFDKPSRDCLSLDYNSTLIGCGGNNPNFHMHRYDGVADHVVGIVFACILAAIVFSIFCYCVFRCVKAVKEERSYREIEDIPI